MDNVMVKFRFGVQKIRGERLMEHDIVVFNTKCRQKDCRKHDDKL